MKYTGDQLRLRKQVVNLDSTIETCRWQIAKLADAAEAEGVPAWAEIIGVACRRSPSTVYEWRKAHRLRKTVNPKSSLSISYWITAANGVTDDNYTDVLDWLTQCEADDKITLESARAQFPRKGKAEPQPAPLRDSVLAVCDTLTDLTDRADFPAGAELFVRLALHALGKLLARIAEKVMA